MLYWIAHVMVSFLAKGLLHLRVLGLGHVPLRGGAIIAANHSSYMDIPLLGCALSRRADFLGKAELFRNPIVRFFFRRLGGIPIRREGVDRLALKEMVRRLKAGRLVVYYPEGTRSLDGRIRSIKPGIGLVAAQAGVPIVPALIEGTSHILPQKGWRPRLDSVVIKFGSPLEPHRFGGAQEGRDLYVRISEGVRDAIQALHQTSIHEYSQEKRVQHI